MKPLTAATRTLLSAQGHAANAGTTLRHPAEQGAWIWHPDSPETRTALLRFKLTFTVEAACSPTIHVTADQRYQLKCDGQSLSYGPDRCDLEHWSVQSLKLDLAPGEHTIEALVWWIGATVDGSMRGDSSYGEAQPTAVPAMAQMTWRGGFLLFTEELAANILNTGTAPWQVEDLTTAMEITSPDISGYHDVGPSFHFDMQHWANQKPAAAATIYNPVTLNPHGVICPGWRLHPTSIPEQARADWTGGRIRAVRSNDKHSPYAVEDTQAPTLKSWQALIGDASQPITIPPHSKQTILWDLEDYLCAYPKLSTSAGNGTVITWEWAESLYDEASSLEVGESSAKGARDQIIDKVFNGFGDSWEIGSATTPNIPALWWRSGRYIQLSIETRDEALTINSIGLLTTRYPLEKSAHWDSSDQEWNQLMPIFDRTFKTAAHETWTDSPYYEQLCYVGDTRLHCLSNYLWYADDRISRLAITQFNWSRRETGLVAERYPSAWSQQSITYSMLWPMMIRDYTIWRDDADFIQSQLPGLRSLLAELESFIDSEHHMSQAAGWPFIDWATDWDQGCGPGVREGDSSILNLHWVLCLQASAEIETAHGDPILAARCLKLAEATFNATIERYWDKSRNLLLDTSNSSASSEHAQFYALLTGLLNETQTNQCLDALKNNKNLSKATIYGAFYLLNALYLHGEEAEMHKRLAFWRELPAQGFLCTPEAPEPSRSDSHAWGAHPAWHTLASIAGIRSSSPGFKTVRIAPQPGTMNSIDCSTVHPNGEIRLKLDFDGDRASGAITLPKGVTGAFTWKGTTVDLHSGKNVI
tara:strand:- start:2049 stop:4493 length:2445 start_codon:yes stop_codon:yes gene_type:complete